MLQPNGSYQDPGWFRAGRGYFGSRSGLDGIVALRIVFLSLTVAALLILFVLTLIFDDVGVPSPALLIGITGLGAVAAFAARRISRAQLDPNDAAAAAAMYRSRFFLAFAINEAPLLLSFVACFLTDELWPYLVELPIFLIGMAGIAPGRSNLERIERDLMSQGAAFSLRAELAKVPPEPR